MALIGAILGDIAGSQYEFRSSRPKTGIDSWTCPLYTDRCVFTDDTVLTLAIKKAVLENADFADTLKEVAKKYKYVGYGTFFSQLAVFRQPGTGKQLWKRYGHAHLLPCGSLPGRG